MGWRNRKGRKWERKRNQMKELHWSPKVWILSSCFGFCETWKSEPWISIFPEVKWVVRLVDHQGPSQHFLWSFTSPKLWALASLFFSHHNCSFCLWKSMYFQKRYSYIKKQNYFYNNVRQNVQIKAGLYSCIFHALYKSSISDRRTWTTRLQKCWTTSGC